MKVTIEKSKKNGIMDKILIVIGIALVVFIIDMRNIYVQTGGVPGELIAGVFTIAGGECGIMGWIQTTKTRKMERQYELEDRMKEEDTV
ncbi:MAG: hypothetical protein J6K15_06365 [Lachnospiraceae bacterium]|nr:hypothetical protein [Lachnospiraceae bacterium]